MNRHKNHYQYTIIFKIHNRIHKTYSFTNSTNIILYQYLPLCSTNSIKRKARKNALSFSWFTQFHLRPQSNKTRILKNDLCSFFHLFTICTLCEFKRSFENWISKTSKISSSFGCHFISCAEN